jgi:transposase
VLADRGVHIEQPLWTRAGRAWLGGLGWRPPRAPSSLTAWGWSTAHPIIAGLERDLLAHARPDPRVAALTRLPGVGPITAMTLLAEIGDIGRFPTARKLCAWAGLTPAVRNSDRRVRHGHITKQGSPWVRWVLVEAAHKAATRPPFARFFATCAARRGRQIATVAVARKLLARCFHILKEVQTSQAQEKATASGALAT